MANRFDFGCMRFIDSKSEMLQRNERVVDGPPETQASFQHVRTSLLPHVTSLVVRHRHVTKTISIATIKEQQKNRDRDEVKAL